MARKKARRTWDPYDDVLLYTCTVLATIRERRWEDLADVQAHFRPYAEGERILLDRPYTLLTWRALGDGTWMHSGGVYAVGRGAVPLMLGAAVGNAIGNGSRRRAAAAAAVPRWAPDGGGHVFVSTHGIYLHTNTGLHHWTWSDIDGASIPSPGTFQMQGQSTDGPVNWQICSHAAELVFVLWALARHHDHPQLVTDSWLPPNWAAWAAHEQGRVPPAVHVPPPALP